ncbi:MAG: 2-amino-4-hydroxy-6-hydroxymethyldihydropteridine diphosphokinase [Synergistaceae bacterium]|nr:2-amino-4-hydroxy-6-hydroxymethyldihydropteridine diphosphokinase [Synergistaceae bacterium]
MHIYFGLGSNLGDRLRNLRDALAKLAMLGKIEAVSSVYETPAWGGVPQPDYLNACVKVEVDGGVEPVELLRKVKGFEAELGRVPSVRWGERKIDIDILLIDDVVYHSEELDIPHIRIPERMFVLVPLSEILPDGWRHPENGKGVREMIASLISEAWPVKIDVLSI